MIDIEMINKIEEWEFDIEKEYFHNDELNIAKLYFNDEDDDDIDIVVNKLFDQLYTFYTNKLEEDKCLDIDDYDIIIKGDNNNDNINK